MTTLTETQVRLFASAQSWIEGEAVRQLYATAKLPGVRRAIGFPDLHPGKGTPVGAAFVTEDVIYPHIIGGDSHTELAKFCAATGLSMVREVWHGEFRFTLPQLVELASAQDYLPGRPAEGIVMRPLEEARSRVLESGRLSAKVISERYSLKHGE